MCASLLAIVSILLAARARQTSPQQEARRILDATGVKGGLIVHVGCGDGKLTVALRISDRYTVHGLEADPARVAEARSYIQAQGIYGPVSVERYSGLILPYTDNLINLIVVQDAGKVSMDEVIRVLVPNGVAYIKKGGKWTKTVKRWPKEIDEWTHFLHEMANCFGSGRSTPGAGASGAWSDGREKTGQSCGLDEPMCPPKTSVESWPTVTGSTQPLHTEPLCQS